MPYYLAGRTSSQEVAMQHSEYITAGSPAAATRIARRMLDFARRHSAQGILWDSWYVGRADRQTGRYLIFAQGKVR